MVTVAAEVLVAFMPTMLSVSTPVKEELESTVPSTIRPVRSVLKLPPLPPVPAASGLELTLNLLPCSVSVTNVPPLSCMGGRCVEAGSLTDRRCSSSKGSAQQVRMC